VGSSVLQRAWLKSKPIEYHPDRLYASLRGQV
jgi:hypothetical protein